MTGRNDDPAWLHLLDRAYALALYLYPAEHRRDYGPWIRQALRDRAREVVRGERSLSQLLLELPSDLLGTLWEEHTMSFSGFSLRRVFGWVGALGLTLVAVLNADRAGDWYYRHYSPRAVAWRESERAWDTQRQVLAGFLTYLDRQGTPRAQALRLALDPVPDAPWRPESKEDEVAAAYQRRKAEVTALQRRPLDAVARAALVTACGHEDICDPRRMAAMLQQQATDNAHTWLWALHLAKEARDENAQRNALRHMADATYFADPSFLLTQEVIRQRRAYRGDDAELDDRLYERTRSFSVAPPDGLIASCADAQRRGEDDVLDQCRRIGARLSNAGSAYARSVGLRVAYRLAVSDDERAVIAEQYRQNTWLRRQSIPLDGQGRIGPYAHGTQWLAAWETADSEVSALQHWLESRQIPRQAPTDFRLSASALNRLAGVMP